MLPEDWIVTETVSFRLSAVVAGRVCLVALEWTAELEERQQTAKAKGAGAKYDADREQTRVKDQSASRKVPMPKVSGLFARRFEGRWGALVEEQEIGGGVCAC